MLISLSKNYLKIIKNRFRCTPVAHILPKNAHFKLKLLCSNMIPQRRFCIMKDNLNGIGIFGRRHYDYLKKNKPTVINVMRMNGTLNSYLKSVDSLYGFYRVFWYILFNNRQPRALYKSIVKKLLPSICLFNSNSIYC